MGNKIEISKTKCQVHVTDLAETHRKIDEYLNSTNFSYSYYATEINSIIKNETIIIRSYFFLQEKHALFFKLRYNGKYFNEGVS